jgi:PAS domain S-box-containing protein
MEKLLSISQDFLQISTADVDFEKIANNLLDLSGAKFAVLNLYEENGKDFRTAAAAGMNNLVKKVSEVLGFELTGKKWKQDPARAEKIKNSTIVRFATLQDLSCKVIPKTVMSVVQKTFHPGETIIVNINVGAKTIGDFTIIMPKGVRFEADDLVSVYARQVGLLLQRKQAEDEMRRSETFINSLFNAIPTPVYYKDTQGRFVRVNQEMSRIIGLPEEQILGKTVFFLNPQEKAQEYHKKDLELLSSGESQRYESVVFDTDGKPHAMIFHKAIHKSQNGKPEGYIGVLMDISERKQMEETLAFEKQRLANIIEATEVGTWEWNIQTWENVFNERYMGMLGYTLEELPATSKTWESLIHPEDRVISDRQLDMHLKGELDYYECEVRMRHKNGAWIWVQDRGKVTRWTDDGKPLMMYGTHQDITERKQAEEVRRQLEEKFTKAFNISPDAISITSMEDGCYIDVNEGFCRISGYSREEAVGKTSNELNLWPDPEDRKAIVRGLTQDGLVENLELSFRMKGGEIVTGLVSANIIEIEGKSCILAVIRDISERKRMEEALRYSEERFRLLFVEMAEGFALHEIVLDEDQKPVDYRFLEVNPAFEKQTGLKRDEIIGRSVKEVLPATEDYWIEAYGEVALKGTVRHFENYSSELNKWFNVAAFCPKYGQFATTVEDITERKLTDQALLDSKLKLEKAQRHAHIGSWTWDIKKNSLEWSEEMFRIFGLDKETFSGFLPDVMNNSIHPDDREAVEASNRSVAEQGKPIPLEYRIVLPDETVKTVWAEAGEIELDDKGSPSRLSGIVQDITDRKLADLALKESEEHFRQVTETINEVFWLCDAKTEDILYVSPNFETVFGRTCESFYENPRSFLDYVHPDDVEDIRMGQIALREQGINSDQEYRILRPDGEVRWLHGKVFPVKDSEGRTIRYTGTDEDITERRQLDEALREREHLLNQIFDILPVGLWIANAKGELVRSNPAGRKIWGAEPLVGQEEYGLFKARRLPSREVLAAEDWALVKTIKEGVTIQNEMLEIDAFDGEKRTILNSTAPVLNDDSKVQSAVIVNLDITDWMRTEEALKSTQLQFQSLIENAPDGIALLNEAMQFVYVSPAGRKIFGYDMEDSLAAAPDALTHPDDLPAVLSELQKIFIKPGLMTTLQYRFKHKDGSYRWLESIFTNLLHEPSVNGIIINFRDITDRRAAEQKVQEQINELRRWNAVTLGRENRVLELKQEVNRLCKQAGLPPVYGSDPIQEQNHD